MILEAAPVIVSVTQDHSSKGTDQKHLINSLQKQHRYVVCTLFTLVLQCCLDSWQTEPFNWLPISRRAERGQLHHTQKMAVVALDIFQTSVTSSLQGTNNKNGCISCIFTVKLFKDLFYLFFITKTTGIH